MNDDANSTVLEITANDATYLIINKNQQIVKQSDLFSLVRGHQTSSK